MNHINLGSSKTLPKYSSSYSYFVQRFYLNLLTFEDYHYIFILE